MKSLIIATAVCLLPSGLLAQGLYFPNPNSRLDWQWYQQQELIRQQKEQTRIMQEQLNIQRQQQLEREYERQRMNNPFDSFMRGYKAGRDMFR